MAKQPLLTQLHIAWLDFRKKRSQAKLEAQRKRISKHLSDQTAPKTDRAENDFDKLQKEFENRYPKQYTYDGPARLKRANAWIQLLHENVPELSERHLKMMDAGAGEGMFGTIMSIFGHNVILCDLEDWRMDKAKETPFFHHDCTRPFPAEMQRTFDLVTSFNSFEHFPDPGRSFHHLWSLLKPGGVMHLAFNPIYCSAWGLHAYGTVFIPYAQFLFSDTFIHDRLKELGVKDLARTLDELQYLNQWKAAQFKELWSDLPDGEVIHVAEQRREEHLDLIERYPECVSGRGLTVEDLSISGYSVLIRKSET